MLTPDVASWSVIWMEQDTCVEFPGTCLVIWFFKNPFHLNGCLKNNLLTDVSVSEKTDEL